MKQWFMAILKKGEGVFHKTVSIEMKLGWFLCLLGGCVLAGIVIGQI